MPEQVYTSRIRLERVKGPLRHAYIEPCIPIAVAADITEE